MSYSLNVNETPNGPPGNPTWIKAECETRGLPDMGDTEVLPCHRFVRPCPNCRRPLWVEERIRRCGPCKTFIPAYKCAYHDEPYLVRDPKIALSTCPGGCTAPQASGA
ncbi:hypothetical protein K491DRAFT_679515 [Lophiostoma macrostomum CBS 122681]|uniref:Uncharacterized protein n=1 Tax=Lophiostoma macrostomum CBS 122681 TaxID=1314788 RepID=A0A6A6T5M6_9PLEO|nr:hypothetical protein K491DRAFT_679515 [Lophiostoma macrostomum CBS 122681]